MVIHILSLKLTIFLKCFFLNIGFKKNLLTLLFFIHSTNFFFTGIKPSPFGIALIICLFVLSGIYFMTSNNDPDVVSLRRLLIASIDVAEKGGDQVSELNYLLLREKEE